MKQAIATLRAEAIRIYRALPAEGWADTAELRANMIASLIEHYDAIELLERHANTHELKQRILANAPVEAQKARAVRLQAQIDRVTGSDPMTPTSFRGLTDQAAAEKRGDWKPTFSERFERTPEGTINNCALVIGESMDSCQICNGNCPDKGKFGK